MCRVWRFYQIVCGFLYKLPECPKVPEYSVISTFSENITSVRRGSRPCNTEEAEQIFYCTDEQPLKSMSSLEELQRHLYFETHEYSDKPATQLAKDRDMVGRSISSREATSKPTLPRAKYRC